MGFISRKWSYAIGDVKKKAFVDTYGIKSADLKNKLLFKSFARVRAIRIVFSLRED